MWATASSVEHRESFNAKAVEDEHILRKDATCAAFPFDNCDFDPRIGERQGEGPHISTIAASALSVGADVGRLEDASKMKPRSRLTLGDVLQGPDEEDGVKRYNLFWLKVRRAVTNSGLKRSVGTEESTCMEAELRKDITPEQTAEVESLYAFIMRASSKSFKDVKAAVDRILCIWRGTDAGKEGAPCVIAGDEETYTYLRHIMAYDPDGYRQVRRYPGDWHLLLHMAKALPKRYLGAGVELIAKDLGIDDRKSGEGSNYRRAHHALTVMYEGLWTACLEEYCKTLPPVEGTRMEVDRHADGVVEWMEARAKEHKTFCLWKQFLLHDYPAYLTFRVALRTGDFMLRLDALRRIAPIFFIVGKDRYQVLLIDHLMEMARMSKSDLKVMSELFSVNLGKDAYARIGLDERQEVANRLFKTLTKRIISSSLEKMAPRAQLREEAILQYEEKFIERPATERDRCRELVGKREPAVETAISCLRKCPLFDGDAGKDKVVAWDGRVTTQASCAEILGAPDQALEKM
ncbi:unnamed protein product [Pylaiella littoralis]